MKRIVITGSTRGIGLGMARVFLQRGHAVMVSSRSQAAVDRALAELGGGDRLAGQPCEVADHAQVQALWDAAAARMGGVDIWINNAGVSNTPIPFADLDASEIRTVTETTLIGAMNGCQVALRGMTAQGHGHIYTFEGFGSDGIAAPGLAVYGTTKRAIRYFTKALVKETKGGPVRVGTISPGIVVTDMIKSNVRARSEAERPRSMKLYDILADRVETVTPWLVEQVLADDKHGSSIMWLTGGKAMTRFLAAQLGKRRGVMDGVEI